jgi:hypothetical protein
MRDYIYRFIPAKSIARRGPAFAKATAGRPTTDDRGPRTEDRRPTTEDRRPVTGDREPTTDNRQPRTDNR